MASWPWLVWLVLWGANIAGVLFGERNRRRAYARGYERGCHDAAQHCGVYAWHLRNGPPIAKSPGADERPN